MLRRKAITIARGLSDVDGRMYRDSDPYWHRNHRVEDARARLAQACVVAGFGGEPPIWELAYNRQNVAVKAEVILPRTVAEARALAEELINQHNFSAFEPAFEGGDYTPEELERYKAARESYDGLDAYVDEAREEFARNCRGGYAELRDVVEFFEG